MNIAFDTYKQKLNDCRPALDGLADSLNVEGLRNELERLHAMQEAPGFWDDPEKSQKVAVKTRQTEAKIERYEKMCATWDDLMTICEMAAEEDDDSMLEELQTGFETLTEEMEVCRLETLLTGHYDKNNALMSFHAGAGGTEAQDWCQMLYRMYTRWAERHGFTYKILDYLEGDEAGLKSADIMIEGENAYGFLKGENGVHRLVRVSPFDANARRQTSFSAIEVIPDIEDESQDVEIRPEDYEMQVSTSIRPPPPSALSTRPPALWCPARPSAASSRTRKPACGCCAVSWWKSKSESIWTRFPTSRAFSRRLNGAARFATTCSCPTPW